VANSEPGAKGQTRTRTLFIVALAFSILQMVLGYASVILIFRWWAPPPSSNGFGPADAVLQLVSLLEFALDPLLLFYLLFRLGKHVSLAERYLGVAVSLLAAGVVGFAVSEAADFLMSATISQNWTISFSFPDLWSLVATISVFTREFLEEGVWVLFLGFTAIALANFRVEKPPQQLPQ
jgi:hypothetical protein